jgi:uncharacterized membrane protein YedE/YeeE
MRQALIGLASGTLFGAGLAFSGMMDPHRVRGFLDLFGQWDPTLVFVMAGATLVMAAAWLVQRRLEAPVMAERFNLPGTRKIDARLVSGSAIFGIGWGLAGLCPGPALASLATYPRYALVFVGAMLLGMALFHLVDRLGMKAAPA